MRELGWLIGERRRRVGVGVQEEEHFGVGVCLGVGPGTSMNTVGWDLEGVDFGTGVSGGVVWCGELQVGEGSPHQPGRTEWSAPHP